MFVRRQARSSAWRFRSASAQWSSAPSCVARSTTRGAEPASNASCQRGAQRHHLSPALSPGNPYSGIGVERSFPRDRENARNSSVMTVHTVWLPTSSAPVSQHPLRKKPVIGSDEQDSSVPPNTFRDGLRPRPNSLGSSDIVVPLTSSPRDIIAKKERTLRPALPGLLGGYAKGQVRRSASRLRLDLGPIEFVTIVTRAKANDSGEDCRWLLHRFRTLTGRSKSSGWS